MHYKCKILALQCEVRLADILGNIQCHAFYALRKTSILELLCDAYISAEILF